MSYLYFGDCLDMLKELHNSYPKPFFPLSMFLQKASHNAQQRSFKVFWKATRVKIEIKNPYYGFQMLSCGKQ